MKLRLLLLFLLLHFCPAYAQDKSGVLYNGILVIDLNDSTYIRDTSIGSVRFKDKVFTYNCTYHDVLNSITDDAREMGGNMVKITAHKYPGIWSTCHTMKADVYKVQDLHIYETAIDWSKDRKLTADDFKGRPDELSNFAGVTYSLISFETGNTSLFTAPKFIIHSRFSCYDSWIKPEHRSNSYILQHEQAHFDLTEIYARKLYKALTKKKITTQLVLKATEIYQKIFDEYKQRERQYDDETKHSINKQEQQRWLDLIANELQSLPEYKRYDTE